MSATCNGIECCNTAADVFQDDPVARTVYQNEEQCATVECPEGETGDPVTVCIAAATEAHNSYISVADANAKALAAAQAAASAALDCNSQVTYYSTQTECVNCESGEEVCQTASATSTTSQEAADAAASALATAAAQALADQICSIGISLSGLRWELPSDEVGNCPLATFSERVYLEGVPGTRYNITLRIRGVIEVKRCTLGTWLPDGTYVAGTYCNMDGTMDNIGSGGVNEYALTVSSPAHIYWMNAVEIPSAIVRATDYTITIQADSGAEFYLTANSRDAMEGINPNLTVPGIEPYPEVYQGQFLQMDVLSITVAS